MNSTPSPTFSATMPTNQDNSTMANPAITSTLTAVHPASRSTPRTRLPQKRGKGVESSESQTVMLLREVAATKAHIAPHGSKIEAFKEVADALTANIDFASTVDAKSVRDRYERLQRNFEAENYRDEMTSGVGGEISESQELLSPMKEAREEKQMEKARIQEATGMRKQRKLEAGERLVANATACPPLVDTGSDDDSDNSDTPQPKRAKRSMRYNQVINCEMDRFTATLKQSDAEQLCVEHERLAFEREKFEEETRRYREQREDRRAEAELERADRKEERESRDRMELEKFKVMMDILRQSK